MEIRTIPRPSRLPEPETAKPCPRCGARMVRAMRYGPTPEPIDVDWCLDGCGEENPPLYPKEHPKVQVDAVCEYRDHPYRIARYLAEGRRFCDRAHMRAWYAEHRSSESRPFVAVDACEWCRTPLTEAQRKQRQRYCSRSHAASASNMERSRRGWKPSIDQRPVVVRRSA
jgi:hypothetical protein